MKSVLLKKASKIWNMISIGEQLREAQLELEIDERLRNIFEVGDSYYYVFDLDAMEISYMSKNAENVLGYTPQELNIAFLVERIHPEDQPWFLNIENMAVKFYASLTIDQIPNYKLRYDYRIQKSNGEYIRILQQVVTIQYAETGRILKSFGTHTDISHLKMNGTPVLSFIGLNGEPSFINVEIDHVFKITPSFLSKREADVLLLLVNGKKTQDIAEILFISQATVSTHRKNILAKTKARNTSELVAMAIVKGWV